MKKTLLLSIFVAVPMIGMDIEIENKKEDTLGSSNKWYSFAKAPEAEGVRILDEDFPEKGFRVLAILKDEDTDDNIPSAAAYVKEHFRDCVNKHVSNGRNLGAINEEIYKNLLDEKFKDTTVKKIASYAVLQIEDIKKADSYIGMAMRYGQQGEMNLNRKFISPANITMYSIRQSPQNKSLIRFSANSIRGNQVHLEIDRNELHFALWLEKGKFCMETIEDPTIPGYSSPEDDDENDIDDSKELQAIAKTYLYDGRQASLVINFAELCRQKAIWEQTKHDKQKRTEWQQEHHGDKMTVQSSSSSSKFESTDNDGCNIS